MSYGFVGRALLSAQDENTILYAYSSSNINLGNYRQDIENTNGIIRIDRSAFFDPIMRKKIKRMPGGRKKQIIRRIVNHVDAYSLISSDVAQIDNCSACWKKIQDIDFIALRLLSKIVEAYQKTGEIPENVTFFV